MSTTYASVIFLLSSLSSLFFLYSSRHHRDLHSFPTRRSSDLPRRARRASPRDLRGRARDPTRPRLPPAPGDADRKSTRLNSSHVSISYAVFCLKKKKKKKKIHTSDQYT